MLEDLCCYVPLKENHEKIIPQSGEFVEVGDLSFLKLNTFSDVNVKVNFEWSYNSKDTGVVNCYQTGSNLWRFNKLDVSMKYLRIRILNETGIENNKLVVNLFTKEPKKPSLKFVEPPLSPTSFIKSEPRGLDDLQLEEESHKLFTKIETKIEERLSGTTSEERTPSTQKKRPWFSRKDKPIVCSHDKIPPREHRLPDYISEGVILIGGPRNTILQLPKGNVGEYLMLTENGPMWCLPTPKLLQENGNDKWVI